MNTEEIDFSTTLQHEVDVTIDGKTRAKYYFEWLPGTVNPYCVACQSNTTDPLRIAGTLYHPRGLFEIPRVKVDKVTERPKGYIFGLSVEGPPSNNLQKKSKSK